MQPEHLLHLRLGLEALGGEGVARVDELDAHLVLVHGAQRLDLPLCAAQARLGEGASLLTGHRDQNPGNTDQ